jgi:hypothetical protein
MRATGWHDGERPREAVGYGIKFTAKDRDQHFNTDWTEVIIDLGDVAATVPLSPSFWSRCSELRSATIGTWLLATGAAPWSLRNPPGIAVRHVQDNRFTAKLIKVHDLL